jgi:hypothetical protein
MSFIRGSRVLHAAVAEAFTGAAEVVALFN